MNDIDGGMKSSIKELLPSDVLDRVNGRLQIVVTKLWPNPTWNPLITSHFASEAELVDHIAASCFIPLYSARRFTTKICTYGDEHYFADGGILAFM